MLLDYERATEVYHSFSDDRKVPSQDPYYIEMDAMRSPDLASSYYVYEEGSECYYHAFLQGNIEGTAYFDIQSPYGYGGPISSTDDPEFIKRAWEAYLEWCNEHMVMVEFIRFHPLLENWRYYMGENIVDRETVWVNLEHGLLMPSYATRVRTTIRKALNNGLQVEWWNPERFLGVFPSLYSQRMNELGANGFYSFTDTYHRQLAEWDKSQLGVVVHEGEVLAAAVFLLNGYFMEYHLSTSTQAGMKLGATTLLLHEGMERARLYGCRATHLGGGSDKDIKNPLLFFKAGFSNLRSCFMIGKYLHCKQEYETLKSEWQNSQSNKDVKILFYR